MRLRAIPNFLPGYNLILLSITSNKEIMTIMMTFVTLFKWTAQGAKTAKDSVERADKARQQTETMGGRMSTILWTQGRYDLIAISEWPDQDTYTAFMLALAAQGNLQTETMQAFSAEDMTRVFKKMG
jgi:uncharacterized protein with GYD domain